MSSTRQQRLATLADGQPQICPSLLNCDFGILADEIACAEKAGARVVHWDVMDGDFCPNFTYGPPVIKSLRPHTDLVFDVHLMVENPGKYLDQFLAAGADIITFHVETGADPGPLLSKIHEVGAWGGLALNPPTPLESVEPWISTVDLILVMSVMPGFGGQIFDESVLSKVRRLKELRSDVCVEIDGGINQETIGVASKAGTSLFVVGSAFYNAENRSGAFRTLAERLDHGQARLR